jgi:hypothetical protein
LKSFSWAEIKATKAPKSSRPVIDRYPPRIKIKKGLKLLQLNGLVDDPLLHLEWHDPDDDS